MKTYEQKIRERKFPRKIVTIRVTDQEIINFLEDLKKRKIGISRLTRELWKDCPDFQVFRDRERPFVSKEEFERMDCEVRYKGNHEKLKCPEGRRDE